MRVQRDPGILLVRMVWCARVRIGYLLRSNLNHFEVRIRCFDLCPQRSQDGIDRKRSYWRLSQMMDATGLCCGTMFGFSIELTKNVCRMEMKDIF